MTGFVPYGQQTFGQGTLPTQTPTTPSTPQTGPLQIPTGYTVEDLTKDEFFLPIQQHMVDRFGSHILDEDKEEVITKYINKSRGFAGGNSVRAVSEISFLSTATEEELARAGQAYQIFEGLPKLFAEESSWANTLDGVGDYVRSGLLDPVNVMGGIIGKSVTSGGFKTSAAAANVAAREAYKRAMIREVAKKTGSAEAQKTATNAASRVYKSVVNKNIKKQAERRAMRDQVLVKSKSKVLERIATKGNVIESATYGAIDGIAAGATDWAYQSAMEMTGVYDERSIAQSGITALAALGISGSLVSLGGVLKRDSGGIGPLISDLKTDPKGAKISGVVNRMAEAAKKAEAAASPNTKRHKWAEDVAKGKELNDVDTDFWKIFIHGDDELEVIGLADKLVEQNYAFIPKDDKDKISNFLGDVIKEADPEDFKLFIKEFEDFTGGAMPQMAKLTQEEVGEAFKKKASQAGIINNVSSQAAKKLGIQRSSLTGKDVFNHLQEGRSGKFTSMVEGKMGNLMKRDIPRAQNQLIRLLVANLSTTQLNLLGWSVASTMDTATDLVTAAVQMPYSIVKGDKQGIKNSLITARSAITKLANTVDSSTTYDQFMTYANARPKALKELTHVLPGGVEDVSKIFDGMDLDAPLSSLKADQVVDFIQATQLVTAQDGLTKSIEFMTALDSGIRKQYGQSYKDFMKRPDYWARMSTEEFQNIEQQAVTKTLDNIFSRSYGKMDNSLGEIADVVEKVRNVPVLGVLLPFGRFFNNTVAFMSDYSGASLALRLAGVNRESTEATTRLAARTAVGWAAIASLASREEEFIEKGLAWDEQTQIGDFSGAITSEKYNFPYSFLKGAARIVAHHKRGEEIPEALLTDLSRTVGLESFTRSMTDAFGTGGEAFLDILQADDNAKDALVNIMGKVGAQVASSATRWVEPVDALVGMSKGTDRVVQDRRQGNAFYNDTTRYMSNLVSMFGQEDQRVSATRGNLRPQDTRFISPVREVKTTNMSRIAAMAGVAEWDKTITMIGKSAPASSNRYAQLYNRLNERAAGLLLNDQFFIDADQETRGYLTSDLLTANKKLVTDYMEADMVNGDYELLKIAEIQNRFTDDTISKAMKEIGLDGKLDELDGDSLITLESMLDMREELKKMRP